MTRNYYFLAASLADVSWGREAPRGSLDDLIEYVEPELYAEDALALRQLFLFNDMRNAVSHREPDDPFVTPSCYDRDTLVEASEGYADVLPFMNDFFEAVRAKDRSYPDIPLIDELTILFYDHLDDLASSFVRDYYLRELNVRNLTIALSRESHGFPYRDRLIPFGDAYEAIMVGTPPDFGLIPDYPFVEELVRVFKTSDLTLQEETMSRLRWQWLDERVGPAFFSTEFVLAYILKYQSVERWQNLSEEKGDEAFGELLSNVRRSVRFALEFSEVGEEDDDRSSNRDQ